MRALVASLALLIASPAASHEFWIEPLAYQIPANGMLQAELVNGELFDGARLSYLPQRFSSFTMHTGDESAEVENRLGARPALDTGAIAEGLHVVAYTSQMSTLTYDDWQKFQNFIDHKDFGDVLEAHRARGLPQDRFVEGYWRYAKTLIGAGAAQGEDRQIGLLTEFVALENPYVADMSDGIDLQLFYEDAPRGDAQVEMFEKAPDGTVAVTLHRTDAQGRVTLPVTAGHSYLVDAVVLRAPSAEMAQSRSIAWESHWAALTFAVPN